MELREEEVEERHIDGQATSTGTGGTCIESGDSLPRAPAGDLWALSAVQGRGFTVTLCERDASLRCARRVHSITEKKETGLQ